MNWRTWPESTAALTRSIALLNESSVTEDGSSPFAFITTPSVSAISVRSVIFPFSFESSSSWSIEVIGVEVSFAL